MIANPRNKNSYAEPFDLERLEQIASDVLSGRGTNGGYSDLECHVHSLFKKLVHAYDPEVIMKPIEEV
jgi:hypothetical protein